MVTKNKIIEYCCETPGNTNKMVLDSLLEDFGGSDKPTGTIKITENGKVDVAQYAEANVNVSGGGYEEVLLWENPNPLNEFSRTFNVVSYNIIKEYDYLIMTYASEGPNGEILETPKSELHKISNTSEQYIYLFLSGINEYSNFWHRRQLIIFNYDPGVGDGIMIDDCMRVNGGITKYNTQMIPYKIYGVKLG